MCGRRARSASCWVSAVTSAAGAAAKQQPSEVTHSEAAAALIRLGVPQPRAVARCRTLSHAGLSSRSQVELQLDATLRTRGLSPPLQREGGAVRASGRAMLAVQGSQCKARSASWRSPFSLRWGCNRGVGGSGNMGRLILGLTRFP